jgi:hypothetical protein
MAAGRAPEHSEQVVVVHDCRVADVPALGSGGLVGQDVAARNIVDVDVTHPPVHCELLCLTCKNTVSEK